MKAVLTASTCTSRCWNAKGKVCRCSCGGVNHGIAHDSLFDLPQRPHELLVEAYESYYAALMSHDRQRANGRITKRAAARLETTRRELDAARIAFGPRRRKPDPAQLALELPGDDPFEDLDGGIGNIRGRRNLEELAGRWNEDD